MPTKKTSAPRGKFRLVENGLNATSIAVALPMREERTLHSFLCTFKGTETDAQYY
jgi:hypothetical protein